MWANLRGHCWQVVWDAWSSSHGGCCPAAVTLWQGDHTWCPLTRVQPPSQPRLLSQFPDLPPVVYTHSNLRLPPRQVLTGARGKLHRRQQFSSRWSLEATSESGCLQMSLWGRHPQATWKHPGHARFFFLLPDKSLHRTLACVAETHCVYGVGVAAASEASRSREQGPCKGVGQRHPRDRGGKSVPTLSPPGSQSGPY